MPRTLFTNVRVFDGTGAAPFAGEVLVQGNRIEAVAKGPASVARDGAHLIDGGGATLMPGMTEGHGHLSYTNFSTLNDVADLPPEDHALMTAENAVLLLDCGFTSVFSAGSPRVRMDLAVREAIETGRMRGPRLRASSPAFVSSGGLGDQRTLHSDREPVVLLVDGPDEMRRVARVMVREGVDSIKVNVSGDPGLRTGADMLAYTQAEVAAVAEVALYHGLNLTCHARGRESVTLAAKLGFNAIFHCDFADSEALDALEARKDSVFLAPAIGHTYALAYEAAEWGTTPEYADKVLGLPRNAGTLDSRPHRGGPARRAHRPGWRLRRDVEPHGDQRPRPRALRQPVRVHPGRGAAGGHPMGGELMGMGDELGLVKPGYLADLLCIDGDPTQDITLLQDRDKIVAIMKDGVFHKTPPLGARQAQAA